MGHAVEHKIECGEKVRTDCTVVESNIHVPSDLSLLWDCLRVRTRLTRAAREDLVRDFNNVLELPLAPMERRKRRRAERGMLFLTADATVSPSRRGLFAPARLRPYLRGALGRAARRAFQGEVRNALACEASSGSSTSASQASMASSLRNARRSGFFPSRSTRST